MRELEIGELGGQKLTFHQSENVDEFKSSKNQLHLTESSEL